MLTKPPDKRGLSYLDTPAARGKGTDVLLRLAAAGWLFAVGAVMVLIINYSSTPGLAGEAPRQWPVDSAIGLNGQRPTLVMFAHPQCPCTRASLGELGKLVANSAGKVKAHVVFLQPHGMTDEWVKSDLWKSASAIPGVTVSIDRLGAEARRFHAETSGTTVLYNAQGRLQFRGGITLARGHAGDNPGRTAVETLLSGHNESIQTQTPVFGCGLFEDGCAEGGGVCKQ